ncbi:hypothetical protein TKK_0000824 [Trichogramma kaykai]
MRKNQMKICLAIVILFIRSESEAAATTTTTPAAAVARDKRIIGGVEAADSWHPYQAYLRRNGWSNKWFPGWFVSWYPTWFASDYCCGASIISERYLLTAAHCVSVNVNAGDFEVVVGTNEIGDPYAWIYVAEYFAIHSDYERGGLPENDIAVIRVQGSIQFNDRVQPIRLPPADYEIPDESLVTVTGWGSLQIEGGIKPSRLQMARMKVQNHEKCTDIWDSAYNEFLANPYNMVSVIKDGMICLERTTDEQMCDGDSGSPVVDDDGYQIGIITFGGECGPYNDLPDVAMRITHYVDWIMASMQILEFAQVFTG